MNSVWWQTNSFDSAQRMIDPDKVIILNLGLAGGSGDEDVVSKADANLYTSKNTGKNRVTGEIKKL